MNPIKFSDVSMLQEVTDYIKSTYSGNYIVVENKIENGVYQYSLVFDTPEDETFFRLKYG